MAVLIPALILSALVFSLVVRILKFPKEIQQGRSLPSVVVEMVGLFLLASGATAFLGSAMLSFGLGKHVPESFEFPIEREAEALVDSRGNAYVPLEGKSRIQVYDRQGNFVRGWHFEAYGGSSRMGLVGDTLILVATSRQQKLFTYTTRGRLVKENGDSPLEYESFTGSSFSNFTSDTPFLFLPFTTMFGSWSLGMVGMLMAGGASTMEKKRKTRARNA